MEVTPQIPDLPQRKSACKEEKNVVCLPAPSGKPMMTRISTAVFPALLCAAGFLVSCATQQGPVGRYDKNGNFVNPFPEGTYEHFTADPKYPKTYDVWKDPERLAATNPSNSRIVICLKKQRGLLMNGDHVVMDYPICSGIPSRPTPPGEYKILEKVPDKRSNKYGRIYDAEGNLVKSNADITKDEIPEGGKFVGASMRYWMRLTWDGVGHHIGPMRRHPASHACIRGPSKVIPIVYRKVKIGTPVTVLEDATKLHAPHLDRFWALERQYNQRKATAGR